MRTVLGAVVAVLVAVPAAAQSRKKPATDGLTPPVPPSTSTELTPPSSAPASKPPPKTDSGLTPPAPAALTPPTSAPAAAEKPAAAPQRSVLPGAAAPPATAARKSSDPGHLGLYRLVRRGETDPLLKVVDDAFRQVAESARRYGRVVPLPEPAEKQGCGLNVPCLASLGSLQNVDEVFAGDLKKSENGLVLHVRLVDTRGEKVLGDKDQVIASQTAPEVKVWAESLACKLLLSQDCIGEALVDADLPEMKLLVDGHPIERTGKHPERLQLPVGVHQVRFAIEGRTSLDRPLLVSRDAPAGVGLYAREHEDVLTLESPAELPVSVSGRSLVEPSVRPTPRSKWQRAVGITAAAVGVVALGAATYEGLHSKSLVNSANSSFDQHGSYTNSDLSTISSAHSAATTANVLFAAGGLLAATGLVLAFAF